MLGPFSGSSRVIIVTNGKSIFPGTIYYYLIIIWIKYLGNVSNILKFVIGYIVTYVYFPNVET